MDINKQTNNEPASSKCMQRAAPTWPAHGKNKIKKRKKNPKHKIPKPKAKAK